MLNTNKILATNEIGNIEGNYLIQEFVKQKNKKLSKS